MAVRGAQELTQEEYDKRVKDVSILLHCICRAAIFLLMNSLMALVIGVHSFAMHRGQRRCEQSRDKQLSLVHRSKPQLAKEHAHQLVTTHKHGCP